ncbi:hypothetical protein KC318_g3865 [Hortaea werneckii]|uniref:Uncharacterized protein n=1 Tax=Hortaea werneckii TaxID=91943 RepID=A0A3M6ZV96_HORWE|nr:hypothetical protein KC334_g2542 [Hortaea werneckii]KAI7021466.1 hypothetical protein KC355_g2338 [Hortaea werneckii]KAI7670759.1 hypothetical protein KC318_g3865 [Hortaea werneckii]RMY19168.1 hypothetical protein D0867_04837 [Hortaea werneckii]RMY29358.1 hypothetical protein D0866_08750 [Hortaea werneckii]
MATLQEQTKLLDTLQNELNSVITQTARLYKSARDPNKAAPVAQATKLKRMLPDSIRNFHEALDELEDELQLAKTVMRRDLAVCREQESKGVSSDNVAAATMEPQSAAANESPSHQPAMTVQPKAGDDGDVEMGEAEQVETQPVDEKPSADTPKNMEQKTVSEHEEPQQDQKPGPEALDQPVKEDLSPDAKPIKQASEPPQTDEKKQEEEQPPEAETQSNNGTGDGLDSLFGDAASAGAGEGSAPDFGLGTEGSAPFDFDSFSAGLGAENNGSGDNDSISALLPGLQDYANNEPGGGSAEPDFSALFNTDIQSAGDGQGGENKKDEQQVDDVFGEIMNFGDFNTNEFTSGDGAGADDGNFDFSF